MGIKGKIAWRFMAEKANLTLLQALYGSLIEMLIQMNSGNIQKTNEDILEKGKSMAPKLLARFADKVGQHAKDFKEFKGTLNLAYKYNFGKEFDRVTYINDENGERILYEDADCPLCRGVTLSTEYKDLKYCNAVAGVFLEVLTLRGFEGVGQEIHCKTSGAASCITEIKCVKRLEPSAT